jgi:thioesterase domain-containing protein
MPAATAGRPEAGETMKAPDDARATLLCTLAAGGTGAPLYLVPSVGSTPLSLVRLARAIDPRRPVRSFAYAGLEDDAAPHRTLEAMAAACVEELLAASPEGPYLLGGHCLGGTVALEMALQLEARGRNVTRLVVLDSIAPLIEGTHRASVGPDAFGSRAAAAESSFRRAIEEIVSRTIGAYPVIGPDAFRRLGALLKLHIEAGVAYRARPLRARTCVLRTAGCADAVLDGWSSVAPGALSLHDVPGDTFSMLRLPHVETVGRTLGRLLADAVR